MFANEVYFIYFFVVGTVFGSFLNVVVDRLPKGESVITGRSYCDSCKKKILWHDLIPVVSFLFLKGKCRFCKKTIGLFYPLVELTTGLLFALVALNASSMLELVYLLLIMSTLVVIFFADLKYGIIPFPAVFVGLLLVVVRLVFFQQEIVLALLSALGAFLFFIAIFLLTRGRGMGFGDVVYAFYMGFLLGFPGIIGGLYLSFLTGGIVSLILVLTGKKRLRGDAIPFGPFLVFGTVIMLLFGQEIFTIVRHYISF